MLPKVKGTRTESLGPADVKNNVENLNANGTIPSENIPIATADKVGGIKVGGSLTVDEKGVLDVGQGLAGEGIVVKSGIKLPDGYQAVEFLGSTGQYIENIYTPAEGETTISIELEFAMDTPTTVDSLSIFGSTSGANPDINAPILGCWKASEITTH